MANDPTDWHQALARVSATEEEARTLEADPELALPCDQRVVQARHWRQVPGALLKIRTPNSGCFVTGSVNCSYPMDCAVPCQKKSYLVVLTLRFRKGTNIDARPGRRDTSFGHCIRI
jgi:hypothetical protein